MQVRDSDVRMLRDVLMSIAIGRLQERTYRNVALLAQFPYESYTDRKYFADVLGRISEQEHRIGAPLLSALVVHKGDDQLPGLGFYDLAMRLGKLHATASPQGRETFLTNEVAEIMQYWNASAIGAGLECVAVDELENVQGSSGYDIVGNVLLRRGHERFRASVLSLWANKCAVTGYHGTNILVRASHIKSWKDSSSTEKIDRFNGLPLVPNLDITFDNYLISFDADGKIVISRRLRNAELLGIHPKMRLGDKFNNEKQGIYLKSHREQLSVLDNCGDEKHY